MSGTERDEIINLINTSKKELEKAIQLLNAMEIDSTQDAAKDAFAVINNYVSHADSIICWVKNATSET